MEPAPRSDMLQFAFHWDKKQYDKVVEKEVSIKYDEELAGVTGFWY